MTKAKSNKLILASSIGLFVLSVIFSSVNTQNLRATTIIPNIEVGISNYNPENDETLDIIVKTGKETALGFIVNVTGPNNYIYTIYHFCNYLYENSSCTPKTEDRLEANTTLNLKWNINQAAPGTYKIKIYSFTDLFNTYNFTSNDILVKSKITDIPFDEFNCSNYFKDMSSTHPLCDEVTYLRKQGIFLGQEVRGKRVANLNSYLLRSEYFAIADRLYKKDSPNFYYGLDNYIDRFTDISTEMKNGDENIWWIEAVNSLGPILEGYSDGSLKPFKTLTMAELAKITGLSTGFISNYNEFKNPWYTDIVNMYRAENIYFDPRVSVRRGDAVKLIYDTLMLTGPEPL